MATTKKVARKKVTQKKAVKKTATSLKRAKKTTKKTAKKTVKKTLKAAAKKIAVTDRTREDRTSFNDKLAAVEILHTKKEQKETVFTSKKSKLPSKQRLKKPVLRDKLSLAVFTPAFFPANIDALAIQTARIGGIAFVVLGGFFALNFSQYVLGNNSILTQNIGGMTAGPCDVYPQFSPEYYQCTAAGQVDTAAEEIVAAEEEIAPAEEQITTAEEEIPPPDPSILSVDNTQPAATFSFGNTSPVQDSLPITVTVNGASYVQIRIYQGWNNLIDQFDAYNQSADDWVYDWDTTAYPDGDYFIRARIYNQYETSGYSQDHPSAFEVRNTSTIASPDVTIDTAPSADVTLSTPSPVDQTADLRVVVPDASEVRFAVKDSGGSISYLSGSATETPSDSGVWLYTWDTSKYVSDTYRVTARVKNAYSGNKYNAGFTTVEVEHATGSEPGVLDKPAEIEDLTVEPEEEVAVDVPKAKLSIRDGTTLSGFAEMRIDTPDAQSVRVYAIPDGATVKKHIGAARKIAPSIWILRYYTKALPNGAYDLYPEVTNTFGVYAGEKVSVTLDNATPFTFNVEKKTAITEAVADAATIEQEALRNTNSTITQSEDENTASSSDNALENPEQKRAESILANFKERIDKELQRFAAAYRSKDEERMTLTNERIVRLKAEIGAQATPYEDPDAIIREINKYIDTVVIQYEEAIQEADVLIAERVKENVFADSDKDGISDYDEVRIYNTNPLVADSDGDGFIDGAEIESGFNPIDPKREAAIVYESPKETGVVRADVLKVESITPVVDEDADEDEGDVKVQAVITGTALPNSYVTIYIYSTPVVVTVKTDEDGAWRYRFDKKLEDGEHNVYVGVTDNAGKIVAKSEPFAFIKEAQAFSPIDAAVSGSAQMVDPDQDVSLLSQYMVLLIVSISVVSIGLVLILLGLHLDTRGRRYPEVVNREQ